MRHLVSLFVAPLWVAALSLPNAAVAFEHSKVLPKGVRNLTLKNVSTQVSGKTNRDGKIEGIGKPLEKDIDYARVLKGEKGTKKDLLAAFMLENKLNPKQSLAQFEADMRADVNVVGTIFSYGLTQRLTFAAGIPYYDAKTLVAVAIKPNSEKAGKFMRLLDDPIYNQTESAREVGSKLNRAVSELNKKLIDNGFQELSDWSGSGIGDLTLAAKYRVSDHSLASFALLNGVTIPTGRTKDPNILNDIAFGKGAYGIFSQLLLDTYLTDTLFINQNLKYTYYAKASRDLRLVTEEESIEVDTKKTGFKLGDEIQLGLSLQHEAKNGLLSGLGLISIRKYSDRYSVAGNPASKSKLELDTEQRAQAIEGRLGYSGVNAYKNGALPVPFLVQLEYKKHLASQNYLSSDFITADFSLFF